MKTTHSSNLKTKNSNLAPTPVRSFKDLVVWQRAMSLVETMYRDTAKLPQSEQFGLMSQMRRAAISIPSNIAEGTKRGTRKDYAQFLCVSAGSAAELETQLLAAQRLFPSIDFSKSIELLDEVQRMLTAIIGKLRTPLSTKNYQL